MMNARLVWTAVVLLVAGAAHVQGDCCHAGEVEAMIDCPNPYYKSDKCTDGKIRLKWGFMSVWVDCSARTMLMYVAADGRCADGSLSTWADRCTDLSRPVEGKDHTGWFGNRCNPFGCDCGWECIRGIVNPDKVLELCNNWTPS